MAFEPDLSEIRFGCGLSPRIAPPASFEAMLAGLTEPDAMAQRYPIEIFDSVFENMRAYQALRSERTKAKATDKAKYDALNKKMRSLVRDARRNRKVWAEQRFLRWSRTRTGFRERIVAFWADHFTALGRMTAFRNAASAYVETAIRPNVSGRFSDLLFAVVTHPLMLNYLDQDRSVGPDSPMGVRSGGKRGLNENLAREVLELHTLGVGGPYTQYDVRQLAEAFTGLTFTAQDGFAFKKARAEPGASTILGQSYAETPSLQNVREILDDLSTNDATARHIARKLAVHFVSDAPNENLVEHVAARYRATGGRLTEVYAALLEHPAAWDGPLRNVKPPLDFMSSAFRALDVSDQPMRSLPYKRFSGAIFNPLRMMGQPWRNPAGPDGWPEDDAAWITPQGVAFRLRWALTAPTRFAPELPDPPQFVDQALGRFASASVRFAAQAAETRSDGVGLVLSAPAFQRR